MERPTDSDAPQSLQYALYMLVTGAFLTGGSSQISGLDDTLVQLFALPVLGFAGWHIALQPASTLRNGALAIAALIALVPLLQLVPLPEWLWRLPDARQRLAADLTTVGVQPVLHWSLVPASTKQSFLFLIPPLAAFCATLALGTQAHRGLLRTIMLLGIFSLLLAFLQFGVPAESLLNPFPQYAHRFNGVFANQNHQGTMLVIALIIALSAMVTAFPMMRNGLREAWAPWIYGFLAISALCALPMTHSRAALLIGTFAVAAVPLALGVFDRQHLRSGWAAKAGLVVCMAVIVLGLWATVGWMQVEMVDELRGPLRDAALSVAADHAPLGTGVGVFVRAFEQAGQDTLLLPRYVNHVHNEFYQWWIEASWLAVLVLTVTLAFLFFASKIAVQRHGGNRMPAVAAVLGLTALLSHSWVDYPLRTGSLAIVAGVLAGIVVGCAVAARKRLSRAPVRMV